MVLKETLTFYINNGGTVFSTLLDATKAFDRVDYIKLFKLLVSRRLPPVYLCFLLNRYTNHVIRLIHVT